MSDRERKTEVAVQGAPACKRSEISRRGSCFSSTNQISAELASTPNPGQAQGHTYPPRRQRPQRQGGVTATVAQLAAGPGGSGGSRGSQPQRARTQRPQRQGGVTATVAQLAGGPGGSRGGRGGRGGH